ncbi:MAG: UDP-N-acetylmuramoyl-L-alanine--D-glutamate ligase [Bacteroidia bacterium]|nr:UDP-N-acetylmuramoyl-L-alanine--D-glutamate ligase [Bacteroidia bacterium]
MSKKIIILGAGESGTGAAILAKKMGFDVFLSDAGMIKEKYINELNEHNIPYEQGGHTLTKIHEAHEVIKSPGIPDKIALIQHYKNNNIPVISEIEFAARYTKAHITGITGTNGKTTTTALIYHIYKNAGLNVGLGGNIGESFARQVALHNYDYYVLELSSFQLDGMYNTRINTAILCNITPDHLDRYDYKLENYIASKYRILQNQTNQDAFIYNIDDPLTSNTLAQYNTPAIHYPISLHQQVPQGACMITETEFTIHTSQTQLQMSIEELALQGRHNRYNSMAAGVSGNLVGIRKESIRESLADFENIEHRMEFVTKVHGIEFINDSKATNINSTWYALESIKTKSVWIVGGVDKGNDYASLRDLVKAKVSAIICLGLDNAKIHEAFADVVTTILDTTNMETAVKEAYKIAKKDSIDAVMLSPACASFDLFQNYEDRGWQFKQAVRSL